jgi:hypothetical protein
MWMCCMFSWWCRVVVLRRISLLFLACICDLLYRLWAKHFSACEGIGGTDLAASRGEAKMERQGIASST